MFLQTFLYLIEDHIDLGFGLRQLGCQVRGFIGRDRTGHAEEDAFVREKGHTLALYFANCKGCCF